MNEIPYMMTNTRAEFERVRDLAWPVTDRTAASDAEFRSRIAPFESAPTPPEVVEARVVEEVARAICDADYEQVETGWAELDGGERDIYRRLAAAAVSAYRAAQDGGAEEAVRRVESDPILDYLWRLRETAGDDRAWVARISDAIDERRAALAPQAGDGAR